MNQFVASVVEGFAWGLGVAVAVAVLRAIFHTGLGFC